MRRTAIPPIFGLALLRSARTGPDTREKRALTGDGLTGPGQFTADFRQQP